MTGVFDRCDIYYGDAWGAAHPKSRAARSNVLGCTIRPNLQQPASTYPANTHPEAEFTPYSENAETGSGLAPAPMNVDIQGGTSTFVADAPEVAIFDGTTERAQFTRDVITYESREFFSTYRKVATSLNRATVISYPVADFLKVPRIPRLP